MTRPFAIAVAPNGARRTKKDHPRLPMTADEIARDAAEALEAGAAMIHLHVRDGEGVHTLDVDLYREAVKAVHAAVGDELVVQVTTEAVGRYTPAEQIAVIDALENAPGRARAPLVGGRDGFRGKRSTGLSTALQHGATERCRAGRIGLPIKPLRPVDRRKPAVDARRFHLVPQCRCKCIDLRSDPQSVREQFAGQFRGTDGDCRRGGGAI